MDDVWDDINALVDKWSGSNYSLGRNLYFHLPLFMNPYWIITETDAIVLQEYSWIKDFNIPLAENLDDADALKLETFNIIKNEINEIKTYMSEQHGR